jgi:hypothetical protein
MVGFVEFGVGGCIGWRLRVDTRDIIRGERVELCRRDTWERQCIRLRGLSHMADGL